MDKSAQYGVKCTYTVRAYKKIEGRGYISNYDRRGMSAVVQPAAPKMTVKEAEYKTAVLSWNAIGNADEYTLYRMNPSTKKWEYQATLKETSYRAALYAVNLTLTRYVPGRIGMGRLNEGLDKRESPLRQS